MEESQSRDTDTLSSDEMEECVGKLLYELDPGEKIEIGSTGMSYGSATTSFSDRYREDDDSNIKCMYIEFNSQADCAEWCRQQRTFPEFERWHCLKLLFPHPEECRVLVGGFHTTLAGWVDQKYSQWIDETEPRTEWCPYIREEFIGIFRAVTAAVRALHRILLLSGVEVIEFHLGFPHNVKHCHFSAESNFIEEQIKYM